MRQFTLLLPLVLLAGPALAESTPSLAAPEAPAVTAPQMSMPEHGGMMPMKPQSGKMGMMGGGMMGGGMMQCPMMKGEHVEGKIAFLHTELKITPAQEEAWKGFADTLRADASSMKDHQETMTKGDMQMNMKMRIDMMEKKVASMKAQQTALDKLWPTLTEEQKKAAEELLSQYK